jgi:predicted ATPase/transcriptional regulator with XRE-family HTH domain
VSLSDTKVTHFAGRLFVLEVSFGEWLKRQRGGRGLTQKQLAQQIGCGTSTIRKFESEERRPSVQIAKRIAEIFQISSKEQKDFLRFARGDWTWAPTTINDDSPWLASNTAPGSNLPTPISSLVGREQVIADIQNYLSREDIRLLTLVGPPGIGKTRLSIETAQTQFSNFPDGVFFIALAPLEDPSLISLTIVQALGYVEAKNVPARQQLMDGIGRKQMLILLDNCEHLIEDIAFLASDLLSACSRLKILATSREALRVPGEWLYPVPPLVVPQGASSIPVEAASKFSALTLFAERARAVHATFALNPENIQAVSSICAQLDGLPLGIELIAARMRLMSPVTLLEHWDAQLILSAEGARAVSMRQKTLHDAIAWSYNLLPEEERRLFAYLSVFSGGFTLDAAEAMFSQSLTGKSISALVASLLDKSLLQRAVEHEARLETRYRMLVTIQQFAWERLLELGEATEIRNLHLIYFLDAAHKASMEMRGSNQVEFLHRLAAMRDNLSSALEWAIKTGQTEIALQMVSNLSWFWNMRSEFSEGRLWLQKVVKLPDAPHYPKLYSYTLAQLALHAWLQSGSNEAIPFVEQALSTARAHDDPWNIAWALSILGHVLVGKSDFSGAQTAFDESKVLFQEVHDKWGYAYVVIGLAQIAYIQGDLASSLALHEEGLAAYRQLGDKFFENVMLRVMGTIQVRQGNITRGVPALQEALLIAQQLDSKQEIAWAIINIGDAASAKGNAVRAVHLYLAARNILDSIGLWRQGNEAELEEKLALCRAALSETEFVKAEAQGRTMTTEQAIECTLKVSC